MKERLPIEMENFELPKDEFMASHEKQYSYGYASILYLLSMIITIGSILVVVLLGNR